MRKPQRRGGDITVGIVHWALPPTIGGVESHLADYIRLLHGHGAKVVVLTGELEPQDVSEYAEIEYHELLHLAGNGALPSDGVEYADKLSQWLEEKVREHGVNVIHGHNLHYFSRLPATAINDVCTKLGIARHHTFHNYWEGAREAELVAGWEGRWANSEFVAGDCAGNYKGNPPLARYMGIDPDRFRSVRDPFSGRRLRDSDLEHAPMILQPARLLRWKGPEHSVKMLGKLRDKGYCARLVLTDTHRVIDWDDERELLREDLAKLIDYLDLNDWVSFRHGVYYGDMPGLYNEADIVINPSHGEPLGLVPLEAMAASRPVVVTASGGMLETITRKAGALVADDDRIVDNLYEAVRGFLDSPRKAVRAGRRGRKHVSKYFHMEKYVEEMLHEYRTSTFGSAGRLDVDRSQDAKMVGVDA